MADRLRKPTLPSSISVEMGECSLDARGSAGLHHIWLRCFVHNLFLLHLGMGILSLGRPIVHVGCLSIGRCAGPSVFGPSGFPSVLPHPGLPPSTRKSSS